MFLRAFNGRFSGLVLCTVSFFGCSLLHASGTQSSSGNAEVAVEYRSNGLQEFRLADYQQELLQCSALSAIHMWIPDNIGEDSGSEVRKQLGEDYWLDLSKDSATLSLQPRPDCFQNSVEEHEYEPPPAGIQEEGAG